MFLFTVACIAAFYLLTQNDTLKFKQITWSVYGVIAVTYMIGLLILKPDTTSYVFWVQLFFILLLLPVFILIIRNLWMQNRSTPVWVRYSVSIPVSLLFILTLWICWNMFPIVMYIF
jgi:hypothetical protein